MLETETWLQQIEVVVNGERRSAEVEPRMLLVHFLRGELGLTGTHIGCDTSNCGACTVLLDGRPVKSCTMLAVQADGREITTVEGLRRDGTLTRSRRASTSEHGLQCGFCTPGDDAGGRSAARRRTPIPARTRSAGRCQRQHLPLHGLHEHRQGRRSAPRHATCSLRKPRARRSGGARDGGGRGGDASAHGVASESIQRKEDAPLHPAGAATTSTTSCCRGCCTWRSCAALTPTPASAHRCLRGAGAPRGRGGGHRRADRRSTSSPGCRLSRETPRRCWPPTKCASRARRSRRDRRAPGTSPRTRWR